MCKVVGQVLSTRSVAGVPGGLVGGPRAYQDQFRGFKSHRVHTPRGLFLLKQKNDWRKARERELATFDETRRAVGMLNAIGDKKQRHVPGGKRDDTCDHGLSRRSLRVEPPTS